jgi:hypothetical protein
MIQFSLSFLDCLASQAKRTTARELVFRPMVSEFAARVKFRGQVVPDLGMSTLVYGVVIWISYVSLG